MQVRVDDALDEGCSDRSVDGISTAGEDSRTGRGGNIVLRREHRTTAHYERIHCRHPISPFLNWVSSWDRPGTRIFAIGLRSHHLSTTTEIWQKGVSIA